MPLFVSEMTQLSQFDPACSPVDVCAIRVTGHAEVIARMSSPFSPSDSCVDGGSPAVAGYRGLRFALAQKNRLAGASTFIKNITCTRSWNKLTREPLSIPIHLAGFLLGSKPMHRNCTLLLMR